MAKKAAKKLHRTGRVSRRKARAVAKILHAELASGKLDSGSGSTVTRKKTASGSGSISFHIVSSKASRARNTRSVHKAAHRAAR